MQTAVQHLPMSSTSSTATSPIDAAEVSDAWIAFVERVFERLAAILGSKLSDVLAGAPVADVKREWALGLQGFSADEIRRGIETTKSRKFAPNLPEFRLLCRPSLEPEVAWLEAERGIKARADAQNFAWSHPAVFWAAREFGAALRASEAYAKHRRVWETRLADWFAAGTWPSIPEVKQQLPAPEQRMLVPGSRDAALAQLAALRKARTGYATRAEQDAAEALAMAEVGGVSGDLA